MTNQEASDVLSKMIMLNGRTNGKRIFSEALTTAKYALHYQMEKTPLLMIFFYHCPGCAKKLLLKPRYCQNCGQALNWKTKEEKAEYYGQI